MKILSFTLVFYVLLLLSKPCCIDEIGGDNIYVQKTEQNDNDNDDDCNDICSPFFACGSCTGFSLTGISSSSGPEIIIMNTQETISYTRFVSEFINYIWQPPKIS